MDIPIIISETNSFRHNFCSFKMTSLFNLMKVQLLTAIVANILFSQRVVGYYPQWVQSSLPISSIDFSVVTHVNHAFAWPDENANIQSYSNMFNISNSQTIHSQGAKFLLSLGGWGNNAGFEAVVSSPSLRLSLIHI